MQLMLQLANNDAIDVCAIVRGIRGYTFFSMFIRTQVERFPCIIMQENYLNNDAFILLKEGKHFYNDLVKVLWHFYKIEAESLPDNISLFEKIKSIYIYV